MKDVLKVGLIGASPNRGWAKVSHVPALRSVPGVELAAVVGSNQAKADVAAEFFGVPRAYGTSAALLADPSIDIVTVAVRVPNHIDLVLAAISAGKHVYCEWPLGRSVQEAQTMAKAARAAGASVVVGLQARRDPAVMEAARLVAGGSIGRILSARVYSTTMAWGPTTESSLAFAENPSNAVNLITIQAMHTIDAIIAVLGPLIDIDARARRQFPQVQVAGEDVPITRETFDHLIAHARLGSGALVSVEVVGGRPLNNTPFRLEVVGERQTLVLEGGAARGFQTGRLRLLLDAKVHHPINADLGVLEDEAANVAALYANLSDDIRKQRTTAPDFEHAVKLTRMIDAVLASSRDGHRVVADGWPN